MQKTEDELVSAVAARLAANDDKWALVPWQSLPKRIKEMFCSDARAIIPLVLEYAAGLADDTEIEEDEAAYRVRDRIAAVIRGAA